MQRRTRLVVTWGVVAALLAPVVVDRDSFPLSTYPMYARARGDVVTLATARAIDERDDVHALTPGLIAQTDDPLLAAGELRHAIDRDRADERCAEIATRVARATHVPDAAAVEIVIERHDVLARAAGEPSLVERTVHARCAVPR